MSRFQLQEKYLPLIEDSSVFPQYGYITDSLGIVLEGYCPGAQVGAVCEVSSKDRRSVFEAEVVGIRGDKVVLMALDETKAVGIGSTIKLKRSSASFRVGPELIGRVIDGRGNPLDGLPPADCDTEYRIYSKPINPLKRARIVQPLDLGVRSINGLLTLGKGQRISVMAGSGVGKSVLMGMMAKYTNAEINVIALVGERGREVKEFVQDNLGEEGMRRSIIIVATSDMPPLIRMRAAFIATTIAEYFRSLRHDVLLMMDSVTRFAMAQREVGLSSGEPPTTKGYPPSVFTLLPKLFERLGALESGGSITGIYTVLTEADDINDPIGDAVRSIVDGHIVLSRKLASKGHFPAVDVPYSTSRVMPQVTSKEQQALAKRIQKIMANYQEAEDLINIGAYVKGSNPEIDEAIQYIKPIRQFLTQTVEEKTNFNDGLKKMKAIFGDKS